MPLTPKAPASEGSSTAGSADTDPRLQPAFTPDAIEARSFAIIDEEAGEPKPFAGRAREVTRRLVHTCADFDILPHLHLPDVAIAAGVAALARGCAIYTDTEMARAGMPLRRLAPLGCTVACLHALPGTAERAQERGTTRARAAMELAGGRLGGAIVAVGNAPTALLALLDHLAAGGPPPALVVAMPVGFVNAAESKELFLERAAALTQYGPHGLPCLALRGRKGGSPPAAATVNALAEMALRERG
ncbi:precorrin-8X methylmutase [Nitratidesulfovibrio liaohensis]|uniref:Precorrin-8X methylmutase n=1 Tax=Nitratidesulfovibrio liaohensis TaxID=2604158 RepID=A0ABY9QZS4_9BACT|nr:precorrin-8X methylmutase [Nitratidesulfovibrio liaohensis]WMW64576.1 precorrin-8X methylmutase [Nitratidesulfovibrio liaohensis]